LPSAVDLADSKAFSFENKDAKNSPTDEPAVDREIPDDEFLNLDIAKMYLKIYLSNIKESTICLEDITKDGAMNRRATVEESIFAAKDSGRR
jgi:hypothetical protein